MKHIFALLQCLPTNRDKLYLLYFLLKINEIYFTLLSYPGSVLGGGGGGSGMSVWGTAPHKLSVIVCL